MRAHIRPSTAYMEATVSTAIIYIHTNLHIEVLLCMCARSNVVAQLCPNTSLQLECSRAANSSGNASGASLQHNLASSIFEPFGWEISAAPRCEVTQHRYCLHFNTKKKFKLFTRPTSHSREVSSPVIVVGVKSNYAREGVWIMVGNYKLNSDIYCTKASV